jgi:hypothetical protein
MAHGFFFFFLRFRKDVRIQEDKKETFIGAAGRILRITLTSATIYHTARRPIRYTYNRARFPFHL